MTKNDLVTEGADEIELRIWDWKDIIDESDIWDDLKEEVKLFLDRVFINWDILWYGSVDDTIYYTVSNTMRILWWWELFEMLRDDFWDLLETVKNK